ncbi:hypothetical protein B296_00042813, partial [Ensete ventricosum]
RPIDPFSPHRLLFSLSLRSNSLQKATLYIHSWAGFNLQSFPQTSVLVLVFKERSSQNESKQMFLGWCFYTISRPDLRFDNQTIMISHIWSRNGIKNMDISEIKISWKQNNCLIDSID